MNTSSKVFNISSEHPDKIKFENLVKWMEKGGAETSSCELKFYNDNNRGVHAAKDIKPEENILFVPNSQMITL